MAPGSKYVGDPQLRNWNPWQLWFWIHGGEDKIPPSGPMSQVTAGLAIHEFASHIADDAARKAIKSAAATVIAKNAQEVAGESM